MKFICDQCEQTLKDDPVRIHSFWERAVTQGRLHTRAHQFDNAIMFYGNAFEASEFLLSKTTFSHNAMNRFIRTGMEFLFALRKGGYLADLDHFIAEVKRKLESLMLPKDVSWYLRPLNDVVDHPMCAVDVWMQEMMVSQADSNLFVVH